MSEDQMKEDQPVENRPEEPEEIMEKAPQAEVESTEDGFRVVATPRIGGPSVHYLLDEEKNFRYQEGRPANRFSHSDRERNRV